MKAATSVLFVLVALVAFAPTESITVGKASSSSDTASPISKVLQMLSDLQAKVIAEGEKAQIDYDTYSQWCKDGSKNLGFAVSNGQAQFAELSATIEKEKAMAEVFSTKIEVLAASIASDSANLKAATEIRDKEKAEFVAEELELSQVSTMLGRAIGILEKEMQQGGASMLQVQHATTVEQVLSTMVEASVFSSADAAQLSSFVQNSEDDDLSDEDLGAPAGAVYEGHASGIIETCEGLLDKAESRLAEERKKEKTAQQNYERMKQSLDDEIKFAQKDMDSAKKFKESSDETRFVAEGDLSVTSKALAEDQTSLGDLHSECMIRAQDFEAATRGRSEELKALSTAQKVLQQATVGAKSVTYGLNQRSFLQVSSTSAVSHSHRDDTEVMTGLPPTYVAIRFVRDLAKKHRSPLLAQLASRMNSATKWGINESDVFEKVKNLINGMISKLEEEGKTDATHDAYCEKEMYETNAKKEEKASQIHRLKTNIDRAASRSAQLKGEVVALQKELADLARSQAMMDKMRIEERALFASQKEDLTQGIDGVGVALKVLNEYYSTSSAHGSAEGAAGGIISLLEVVESDFSKDLSAFTFTEENAEASYGLQTKENEIVKTARMQDAKYKAKEATALDQSIGELSSDREGVETEMDAVLEFLDKIKEMCVAKAEPYATRKARRESEIVGLQDALQVLEGETTLLPMTVLAQASSTRHLLLRGAK